MMHAWYAYYRISCTLC